MNTITLAYSKESFNKVDKKHNYSVKCILLAALLFLNASFLYSQPVSQTFNTSGTYVVPAGYTAIVTIQAWGGGGGGNGGGGGGGAYASRTSVSLPAGNYTVTVGTGGAANTNGTASSFGLSTAAYYVLADFGRRDPNDFSGGIGGALANSIGAIRFSGGRGGALGTNIGGGGGGSATPTANGGAGTNTGTAGTGQGAGGAGTNTTPGGNGVAPGGGGGGAFANGVSGGRGAAGRVIVTVNTFLPVTFGDISAKILNDHLIVNWVTLSETNNDYFEIEVSKDGKSFNKAGVIQSKYESGNNQGASYSYSISMTEISTILAAALFSLLCIAGVGRKHKLLTRLYTLLVVLSFTYTACNKKQVQVDVDNENKLFVRIKQVDLDGGFSYSKVLTAYKAD